MRTKERQTIGIYGHTEDEFHSLFSETNERFKGEIQKYYEIWLLTQIRERVDAGATSFITTIRDGVCNWIAKQIVTNNHLHPEDYIELWLVLPPDVKKRKYYFGEWTIITGADGHHIADGTESKDIVRCMMEKCDHLLLFSANPSADIVTSEAASMEFSIELVNPVDAIEGYCRVREKQKPYKRDNIVDLYKKPGPND